MKSIIKRVVMAATIVALFTFATAYMPAAFSSESTTKDKVTTFLSTVVGLDITKYTLIQPGTPIGRYPSTLGGLIKEEAPSYVFEGNGSKLDTMGIFYNGHMAFIKVYPWGDNHLYSETQATNSLDQAKNIIQRYQNYVPQIYAADNAYLVPMQNILNSVDDLSPTNITVGNVNFQVSKDGDNTRIQWIYTEGGVSMKWKRVDVSFLNNTFVSFRDTWRLYSVSELSVISSEDAAKIALETAQNFELRLGNVNGETELVKVPDLSDAPYDISFTMVPYRYQESHIPSKLPRDPLTLYPFWQVHFYFNESIAGNVGMQVGVWGDTKEIVYCSGFGYLGASDTPNEADVNTPLPNSQNLEEQEQPNSLGPSTLAFAISIAAVLTISVAAIAVRHRNQHKTKK